MDDVFIKPEYITVEFEPLFQLLSILKKGDSVQLREMLIVHQLEEQGLAVEHKPTPLRSVLEEVHFYREKQQLFKEAVESGKEQLDVVISITTNKNFRATINGKVDPLLAGKESLYDLCSTLNKKYFGRYILSFDCVSTKHAHFIPLMLISVKDFVDIGTGESQPELTKSCLQFILQDKNYTSEQKEKLLKSKYFDNILKDQLPDEFSDDVPKALIILRPVESSDYE